jgi:hypothetical protein
MNKIVFLTGYFNLMNFYGYNGFTCSTDASEIRKFDDWMCCEFGIKNITALTYEIIDESKFALFILKHSENILEISI